MKRFLGLAAMSLSVFSAAFLPRSADATLSVPQALPIRVTLSGTTCSVYFRPYVSSLDSDYWYGSVSTTTTAGAAICMMATEAVTNQTRITITSNNSWAPEGTGSFGTITAIVVNP